MTTDLIESPFASSSAPVSPTTAGALATQSREVAETQTKYLMAQQFRRDERAAMDGIINAFSRPGLAERASYEYSKGGTAINGASIHAAQAIAQQWGNMEFGFREISRGVGPDGVPFSEVESFATDLQSRTRRPLTFIVRHWRDTKQGGYKLKDERDIYELMANMAQRRTRACILAVLPQDVIDTAMEQAELTLKTKADTSPEATAKMLTAFEPFGVVKEQIEKLIQRRLDAITPAQVVRLKRIYQSMRDEMSTAAEWFDMGEPQQPSKSTAAEAVQEAMSARRKGSGRTTPPDPPPPTPAPPPSASIWQEKLESTKDPEIAALLLDEARDMLPELDYLELSDAYRRKFQKE